MLPITKQPEFDYANKRVYLSPVFRWTNGSTPDNKNESSAAMGGGYMDFRERAIEQIIKESQKHGSDPVAIQILYLSLVRLSDNNLFSLFFEIFKKPVGETVQSGL